MVKNLFLDSTEHKHKASLISKFQSFLYERFKSPRGRSQWSRRAAVWNPVRGPEAALAVAAAAGAVAGGPLPAALAARAQEDHQGRSLCHWMKKARSKVYVYIDE